MTLSVTDLSCARGGLMILQGVSLHLQAGQAMILRGPNGSGKTTLLRTIAGLQPALSGRIAAPEEAMTYAAHRDGLKSMLTVRENLTFWARIHRRPQGDAMQRLGLAQLADQPAHTLSAGQQRRLGLARLLVTGRPIWLLDEPTVSLDAEAAGLFTDVVLDHLASGGIVLMATHVDSGFQAETLDLIAHRVRATISPGGFDEAFL